MGKLRRSLNLIDQIKVLDAFSRKRITLSLTKPCNLSIYGPTSPLHRDNAQRGLAERKSLQSLVEIATTGYG
jgi:hypothetical protein